MVRKYQFMRVPIEAVEGFKQKKKKMEQRIKAWTGKEVKLPMTRVLIAVANNPVEIHEGKVIKLVRRVKKK